MKERVCSQIKQKNKKKDIWEAFEGTLCSLPKKNCRNFSGAFSGQSNLGDKLQILIGTG